MWPVIGGGIVALIGLATWIGLALDRQSRDAAWGRIATSRRVNAETRSELEEQALELEVRETELDRRERWADLHEDMLFRREAAVEHLERQWEGRTDPPELSA